MATGTTSCPPFARASCGSTEPFSAHKHQPRTQPCNTNALVHSSRRDYGRTQSISRRAHHTVALCFDRDRQNSDRQTSLAFSSSSSSSSLPRLRKEHDVRSASTSLSAPVVFNARPRASQEIHFSFVARLPNPPVAGAKMPSEREFLRSMNIDTTRSLDYRGEVEDIGMPSHPLPRAVSTTDHVHHRRANPLYRSRSTSVASSLARTTESCWMRYHFAG